MTNLKNSFIGLLALLVIIASSCNDPTDIGSSLISDQFSDIEFTDTVTVRTLTTKQDSIFTYTRVVASQPTSYMCGYIDDPIFGTSEASIYLDFGLTTNSSVSDIDFNGATFDSLVLSLGYNSFQTYGDTLNPQNLRVYRLSENMDNSVEYYYSSQSFQHFPTAIGEKLNFLPKPSVANIAIEPPSDTLLTFPHIRIPLSSTLGAELMPLDTIIADSMYRDDENFREIFKGIKIAADQVNSNIIGFNVRSSISFMRLYYTKDDLQRNLTFRVVDLSTKVNEFIHDDTGAESEPFVDNQLLSDSLVFTQGLSGYNIKVDFPYIEDISNVVINKAELEITSAVLPGDDTLNYYHPDRLVLTRKDDNGNFVFISDVGAALSSQGISLYGGQPENIIDENGNELKKYRLSLSNQIQEIVNQTFNDNSLYIQVYLKNQNPRRGVFYGSGHSQHPIKLNLTYTKL